MKHVGVRACTCLAAVLIWPGSWCPAAPAKEDELPLKDRVSQYGITWTFAAPARVGQFINGDFYVVHRSRSK